MIETRSVEDWTKLLGALPSPDGVPVEEVVANRILSDLIGYRGASPRRREDIKQLATALVAFAKMGGGA